MIEATATTRTAPAGRKTKTAKQAHKEQAAPAPVVPFDPDAAFFDLLYRIPDLSGDKLEKLLEQHERMKADRARRAFDAAMIRMQPKLPVIEEHGKSATNTYATLEDIIETVRPILHEHGFALTHRVEAGGDKVRTTAILMHDGGHREENAITLPVDLSDGKSAVHGAVSSTTYGRRITSASSLGLVSRGQDDDGNAAGKTGSQELETISKEQQVELLELIAKSQSTIEQFREIANVANLPSVLAKDFKGLRATLRAKVKVIASKGNMQ